MNATLAIGYRAPLLLTFDQTREQWLNSLAKRMAPLYAGLNAPLPARIKIAIGFRSTGKRSSRIGECWDSTASTGGWFEIFIRPDLGYSNELMSGEVAAILAHELTHAAAGISAKHGKKFAKVAKGLGLVGPMKSTRPGPVFEQMIAPILAAVGPLPHANLRTGGLSTRPKPEPSRWIKCKCAECEYQVRTTRKCLEIGYPLCPLHGEMLPDGIESGLRKAA